MKTPKIDSIIRNFLLSEGQIEAPALKSRFLALEEMLSNITGRTLSEIRRLEIIREQVRTIRKDVRRLEEQCTLLEEENNSLKEKLVILEENKEE
jgi:hypothetical protein